ncbi:aldose 1-epimerase-like [Musca vetustissima]|uniref:aldose 1-epimerase-like n=1 Tax=Musca vetustissima TaxID=27455 RepID=UPI002AB7B346|nr:aldose 1-epimerase-like [Musca vetustissima]
MIRVIEDTFGTAINPMTKQTEEIKRFTITNGMQMKVQVITLGATITSIEVPDANGKVEDVVLGYDDVAGEYDGNLKIKNIGIIIKSIEIIFERFLDGLN